MSGCLRLDGKPHGDAGTCSVLIVEDESLISWSLANALTRAGFETRIAVSADGAAEVLDRTNIDLIIADVRLPQGDGIHLAREIRRNSPYMPIIIMTAGDEELRLGHELNDVHYCEKPFHLDDMVERVKTICIRTSKDNALEISNNSKKFSHL